MSATMTVTTEGRTVARGTGWLSAASLGVGAVNYLYALVLTHVISVGQYQTFAAGQSVLLVVGAVAASAAPWVLAGEVARAGSDAAALARAIRFALRLNLGLAVVATGAALVAAGAFSSPREALVIGLSAGLIVLASTPLGWWQGTGAFGRLAGVRILEVVAKAGVGVALAAAGAGAAGALGAFALGSLAVLLVGLAPVLAGVRHGGGMPVDRSLWRTAAGVTAIQALVAVMAAVDVVAVAVLPIEAAEATAYQASMVISRVPMFLAGAIAAVIYPMLAKAADREALVSHGVGLLAAVLVPSTVVLMTVPEEVLGLLFPREFGSVATWMPVTAVSGAMVGFVTLLAALFGAVGRYRRCASRQAAGAVVHLAGIIAGHAWLGLPGLAAGAVLGAVSTAVLVGVEARRVWPGALRTAASSCARWAPAGLALVLVRPWPVVWVLLAVAVVAVAARGAVRGLQPAPREADAGPRGLRILHLGFEDHCRPGSGGGAVRTHQINRRLVAAGHEVTVLTTNWRGARDRVEDGVRYLHIGLPVGYMASILSYFAVLPWAARRHRADLVVEDFAAPFSSALSPLWTRRPTIAMVQWLNSREKSRQYKLPFFLVENLGVRAHRHFIAVSEDLGARLRSRNPRARVDVVVNGVEPMAFGASSSSVTRRDVVFLGRLEIAQKGLDLLLEAFAGIADRVEGDLVLIGDGPDRDRIVELAAKLGIGPRVRLVGRLNGSDKYEALAAASVVAMPSRFETFGMVAAEALACGTPVVAFEIPCLRQVVPPECGVLVEAFDVEAYGAALADLVADPERGAAMGSVGQDFARRFDWDGLALEQERSYRDVVDGGGPPSAWDAVRAWTGRLRRPSGWSVATVVSLVALTVATRAFRLQEVFDVFVDEITYLRISESIATGGGVRLYGEPFFLHPPLFMVVQAAFIGLFDLSGDVVSAVLTARYLVVALAAVSVVAVWRLAERTGGAIAGLAAGVLFALDPFVIRLNSRILLETSVVLFVAAGWLALVAGSREERTPSRSRFVLAGIAFGAAALTKDTSVLTTAVPLIALAAISVVPWRRVGLTVGVLVGTYAPYPLFAATQGQLGALVESKTNGVLRLAGSVQETGFNRPGSTSFLDRVTDQVAMFGASYALLAVGTVAVVVLWRSHDTTRRLLAAWVASAYLYGAFSVVRGTLEEQLFYFMVIPAIVAAPVAAVDLVRTGSRHGHRAFSLGVATTAAALVVAGAAGSWVLVRSTPDDAQLRLSRFAAAQLEPGAVVATVSDTEQFVLRGVEVRQVDKAIDLAGGGIDYVVVGTKGIEHGTTLVAADLLPYIDRHGTEVFRADGRSVGSLLVYRLDAPAVLTPS